MNKIFLHRQNSPQSISKYTDGLEIDFRSSPNGIVLNHDRLDYKKTYNLLIENVLFLKNHIIIANIKESGIEEEIADIFIENNIEFYFLDSQIPDIIRLSKFEKFKGKFILRISDVEDLSDNFLELAQPKYIWVDYSKFNDFVKEDYLKYLEYVKSKTHKYNNILVSPELYNLEFIKITHDIISEINRDWSVCTKYPEKWREHV